MTFNDTQKLVNDVLFINLYGRWLDERKYEDFAEYEKVVAKHLKQKYGLKLLKASKRPFAFYFRDGGKEYQLKVTSREVRLGSRIIN